MKKRFAILLLAPLLGTISCTADLVGLNDDPKSQQYADGGALFANATLELINFMATPNQNINNFRLYAQQWAQTSFPEESNYELDARNLTGRAWDALYTGVIRDLKGVAVRNLDNPALNAKNREAQAAMAEVLEIFAWHLLADLFCDIPYSQAFSDNLTPAYDDDALVYADLIRRLDAAISSLNGESRMGASDLIYGGDLVKWKRFANSLKLRLAIRIADVDDAKASKMAGEAVAAGLFQSGEDDFRLVYMDSPPHTNPLWKELVQSGRTDFVAANTIVDHMKTLNDPRLPYFFKDQIAGQWLGGVYGDNNNYNAFSHPGFLQLDPTFPHTILSYTEVQFLLADAAERGYAAGGNAEDFYSEGVTSSILEWGGSALEADAYLANPAVAYATAPGTWKEKIALQKWIALYDQGFEAWTTWRLYDAPVLKMAVQAMRMPPARYTYPITEFSLNGENVQAAGAAIGGNTLDSKVFWDVN